MATKAITTEEAQCDEPIPRTVLERVYNAVRAETGKQLPDPVDAYAPGVNDDAPEDVGLLPNWYLAGDVGEIIKHGLMGLDFQLRDAETGESDDTGKSHFTAVFVREDLSVREVVGRLAETGQLEIAIEKLGAVVENPVEMVAFALAMYLKGAVVERILTETTERFAKGSVSNDQAGQDVWDNETKEYRQVKCVTHRNQTRAAESILFYQYDNAGHVWVGDDWQDVADAAYNAGRSDISKTLTYRQHNEMKDNRYIWW